MDFLQNMNNLEISKFKIKISNSRVGFFIYRKVNSKTHRNEFFFLFDIYRLLLLVSNFAVNAKVKIIKMTAIIKVTVHRLRS